MSIFKKISFLFVISLILMTIIGLWVDNINSKRMDNLIKDKYLKVIEEVFRNIENKNHINYLFHKNNLKVMKDFKLHAIPIVEENDILIGIVTKTDIIKAVSHIPQFNLWS